MSWGQKLDESANPEPVGILDHREGADAIGVKCRYLIAARRACCILPARVVCSGNIVLLSKIEIFDLADSTAGQRFCCPIRTCLMHGAKIEGAVYSSIIPIIHDSDFWHGHIFQVLFHVFFACFTE